MTDLQAIADRFEIEALPGEYTDALMMRDWDHLASLFTHDGAVRMPHIPGCASSGFPAPRRLRLPRPSVAKNRVISARATEPIGVFVTG
jgi:hypothetical protein